MKLVQQLETATGISLEKDVVESLFSLDEKAGPLFIAALKVHTDSDSSFSESEFDTCYMAAEDTEEINLVNSVPHVPISVYTSKYAKPIKVIVFLDTRAAQTIMNPEFLPQKCWKPFTKNFSTVSSEVFSTHLISKPIKIQFFYGCFLITREDEVKQQIEGLVHDLKQQSCANSHQEFLKKCSHPLWKNEQLFVRLLFKKNENINLTKLLLQDLIESSDSPWACEAFYVNKRSEQVCGKLRLVINYQPLNHFLRDDKFPLPNKQALFTSLSEAKVFSKFDLKAGFWQLRIHSDDRPKIEFCIPKAHYQWKVMPFKLKTAPSLFQKAMCRVFSPIMD
ncbi:hypothetical protein CRG98_017080 [Punica granatum]|uniref:Reverse transcriptase domain-containing protein n=1 Tax=Punica granatum TaxID=22663 RepID=A0A2I0K1U5_PUNGR|nr:hypothetical protein CRG98_017080 [Punica granatum]